MASSPPYTHSPTALSPPPSQSFSSSASNSRKRPSDSGNAINPSLKRRKASTLSVGSSARHPLRQTSFPPDESYNMGQRSPSIDSVSLVSGTGGGTSVVSGMTSGPPEKIKKKRGRKSKAEKAAMARDQTPSAVGGSAVARSVISGISDARGRSKAPGGGGDADEEDENIELDRAEVRVAAAVQETTAEQKAEEHRIRAALIENLTDIQFKRFEQWRASGLVKATVRKLINATVSQSVPENVVLTVRTAAKVFLGDIIEQARRVQGEWMDKLDEKQVEDGLLTPQATPGKEADETVANGDVTEEDEALKEAERVRKWHKRGPLRPDHLREAYRRYKMAREGGGVGMSELWHEQQQSGVERFASRAQGRRLFR